MYQTCDLTAPAGAGANSIADHEAAKHRDLAISNDQDDRLSTTC
jgi:hypothetical protein